MAVLATSLSAAQAIDSITPEQAQAMLTDSIRRLIAPELPKESWISLTLVGGVASPNDASTIHQWANSCPEPSPFIASLVPRRPLSGIYRKMISSAVGPIREDTEEILAAKAIVNSDRYKAFVEKEKNYNIAYAKLVSRSNDDNKVQLLTDLDLADREWLLFGNKAEVSAAVALLQANLQLQAINAQRVSVLNAFLAEGTSAKKYVSGSFVAPPSEIGPPVSEWGLPDGWVNLSYSSQSTSEEVVTKTTARRGGGGVSLGFVTFGGSGGGSNTEVTRVSKVRKLSYSFAIKRVGIRRPWLDTEVFFEPRNWAWTKKPNTPVRPYVAVGLNGDDLPQASPTPEYDNVTVACSLLPSDFIIAKDIVIEATVSEDDFKQFEEGSNASGGAVLFGIIGGAGGGSSSFSDVKKEGDAVSFKISSTGTSVIGLISYVLPKLPDPNKLDKWPASAWIEDK
ncbi:hypothetical protein [Mesorhizobium sp. B2-8-5]|uniref:hypothetical protein n=1 Tax=Mesorhizobium sp. B2-8-5 TaxID=2589903 RepID=UPI001125CCFE|nr:hypothetical protein [Mesorhizobium sp. B2-8-5]UCI23970.1 hypothetical protein FJ430_20445 [Mesorhizobium sp. B2-8-5]